MLEMLWSKIFLPKKNNNSKSRRRRGRKNASSRGDGPRNITSGGGGGVNSMVFEPWVPIFPVTITKRLRYSTTFALSTTAGALTSVQIFRANDLFDPDYSGTGHQPMGFDQLMLWYNHFVVRFAKITCVFKNTAATSPTVCLRIDADSTGLTVIDRIVEIGGCVTADLEVKGSYGANKKLTMGCDIAKVQGVTPSAMTADLDLHGSSAASPGEITYFHITMWDTAAATGSCECDVILEQTATFFEPRDMTES